MVETQNMAYSVILVLTIAIIAVVIIQGSPAGQYITAEKNTGPGIQCFWRIITGSFIVDNVAETAVGSCTWTGDNFNVFDKGVCTVDGITEYRDTCVDGNPNINMREYSCKYVLVNGTTQDYLVTTEGTCTLGCKGGGNLVPSEEETAGPVDACISFIKVRECGRGTVIAPAVY